MSHKTIDLKYIAQKTGYSVKTVSRALNEHPDVSETTREKILNAAKQFSYSPNLIAKSLRTKKTYTIGYIVPDITSEFFGKVGIIIEKEFRKHGYSILMSFTEESKEEEINSLKVLLSKRVDGIVLATVGTTGEFLKGIIYTHRIPVVVIDNKVKSLKTNLVLHDNVNGAYLLTKHLIEHGHKDIACISGLINETSGYERLHGYKKALKESGIIIDHSLVKIANWRVDGGLKAAYEIMKNEIKKPSAIFVANSIMALGVYKALIKMKLKIPNDVAIVSFDNFEFTEVLDPPLTTLDEVAYKIGEITSRLLLEKIKKRDINNFNEFRIKGNLCIRQSCGCISEE